MGGAWPGVLQELLAPKAEGEGAHCGVLIVRLV